MPETTYTACKPLYWLHGEIKTPPFSKEARREAGFLLRCLQGGRSLGMPRSRPMPSIGPGCHELRVTDASGEWRIIYRLDPDLIVIVEVLMKKSRRTLRWVIDACIDRLRRYDYE